MEITDSLLPSDCHYCFVSVVTHVLLISHLYLCVCRTRKQGRNWKEGDLCVCLSGYPYISITLSLIPATPLFLPTSLSLSSLTLPTFLLYSFPSYLSSPCPSLPLPLSPADGSGVIGRRGSGAGWPGAAEAPGGKGGGTSAGIHSKVRVKQPKEGREEGRTEEGKRRDKRKGERIEFSFEGGAGVIN